MLVWTSPSLLLPQRAVFVLREQEEQSLCLSDAYFSQLEVPRREAEP